MCPLLHPLSSTSEASRTSSLSRPRVYRAALPLCREQISHRPSSSANEASSILTRTLLYHLSLSLSLPLTLLRRLYPPPTASLSPRLLPHLTDYCKQYSCRAKQPLGVGAVCTASYECISDVSCVPSPDGSSLTCSGGGATCVANDGTQTGDSTECHSVSVGKRLAFKSSL